MSEIILAMLTLFFIGATADRGQANFHVQQRVGHELKLFDGTIAFRKTDQGYDYYLKLNEYLNNPNGQGLRVGPGMEIVVRTGDGKEPIIGWERNQQTYASCQQGSPWLYREFPRGIITGFGIDAAEQKPFQKLALADTQCAFFNRLDNGGYIMRVKNPKRGDLVQGITMQADKPGEKEWFKEAYVVNVIFDIADQAPADSLFEQTAIRLREELKKMEQERRGNKPLGLDAM